MKKLADNGNIRAIMSMVDEIDDMNDLIWRDIKDVDSEKLNNYAFAIWRSITTLKDIYPQLLKEIEKC
jgi:hypothetical protein